MTDIISLIPALVTGILLGGCFFGGLWWTVQKALVSSSPAALFLISSFMRTAIVLVGFYFVSDGHWQRLLACLFGFVLARPIVIRITLRLEAESCKRKQEGSHAAHS